jgi:hypothetical protein
MTTANSRHQVEERDTKRMEAAAHAVKTPTSAPRVKSHRFNHVPSPDVGVASVHARTRVPSLKKTTYRHTSMAPSHPRLVTDGCEETTASVSVRIERGRLEDVVCSFEIEVVDCVDWFKFRSLLTDHRNYRDQEEDKRFHENIRWERVKRF